MQFFFLSIGLSVSCFLSSFAFSGNGDEENPDKFNFSQLSKELNLIGREGNLPTPQTPPQRRETSKTSTPQSAPPKLSGKKESQQSQDPTTPLHSGIKVREPMTDPLPAKNVFKGGEICPERLKKSLKPKKYKKRLLLGEADFSYTAALLRKHPTTKNIIVATELSDFQELDYKYSSTFQHNLETLKELNILIEFGVDARSIHQRYGSNFNSIHFNFPHDGSNFKDRTLPKIIADFFTSAAKIQEKGDQIHIALPHSPKDDKNKFYQGYVYDIYLASLRAGYTLIKKRKFNDKRYPGYKHRITTRGSSAEIADEGREYIFSKEAVTKQEKEFILKNKPPRSYPVYGTTVWALPLLSTDSDSSDYEEEGDEDSLSVRASFNKKFDLNTDGDETRTQPLLAEDGRQFLEYLISGEGNNCALYALGFGDRKSALNLLLQDETIKKPYIRALVVPEIRADLAVNSSASQDIATLPQYLKRKKTSDQAQIKLNTEAQKLKIELNLPDAPTYEQIQEIGTFEQLTHYNQLLNLKNEADEALYNYLGSPEIFEIFVVAFLNSNQMLTYLPDAHNQNTTILNALARLLGKNLCIMGRNGEDHLKVVHDYIWDYSKPTVYLIHTRYKDEFNQQIIGGAQGTLLHNNWNHFNLLKLIE